MKTSIFTIALLITPLVVAEDQSPYAGQESRQVKSLSESEIQGFLNGAGMGYAKPAELNRYPGPKHVLELAETLDLTEQQLEETQKLFHQMKLRARELGARYVAKEMELDDQFARETITEDRLKSIIDEISALEAEIRYAHLEAHLAQKTLLNEDQVAAYLKLRGYHEGHSGHQH